MTHARSPTQQTAPSPQRGPFIPSRRRRRALVVSNCQTHGVVVCMQAVSELLVDGLTLTQFGKLVNDAPEKLGVYDTVFAIVPAVAMGADTQIADRFIPLPYLHFAAFHPDTLVANVSGPDGRELAGPACHSAIVLACFQHGLTPAQTRAMFRAEIFAALGYMDGWDHARTRLFARCHEAGYTVEEDFYRWAGQGCFMYTRNHPNVRCITDYTTDALRRAGQTASRRPDLVMDIALRGPVYPVYEEIAAAYGFSGSYRFKPENTCYTIGLDEFIDLSFEAYRTVPALELHRFDQPAIARVLTLLN